MLRQGTNRLNQRHGCPGSGNALKARQGSLARGGGSLVAGAECRQGSGGSATALTETGDAGALVTVAMEAEQLRERRRQ